MWIILAIASALGLGFYDISKKISLKDNNVPAVLLLNTLFCAVLMLPVVAVKAAGGNWGMNNSLAGHGLILIKSMIVLSSWLIGYFSIKHLPLTIAGPVNASRPVMVLVGALLIFGERLNLLQWGGVALGFFSLFFISRLGAREGFSFRHSKWLWMSIGAAVMGAVSALYDKYLLQRFAPLEVQGWYAIYQLIIMGVTMAVIMKAWHQPTVFRWKWSILFISIFLTGADLCYFYALSQPGAMIAVVSMIRRGSVIVSFFYGVIFLHEKDVKAKTIDLCVLLIALGLLVAGSAAGSD